MINHTIDSLIDKATRIALVYLIASGKGMSFTEDYQDGNDLNANELSLLIAELQKDAILPQNGKYMRITAEGSLPKKHYPDDLYTKTQILVLDATDQIVQIIPNSELFALRDESGSRYGIKEIGFRRLIESLL